MERDEPTAAGLTRRAFIGVAGVSVLAACTGSGRDGATPTTTSSTTTSSIPTLDPIDHGPPVGENPFTLGVASGDPTESSVLLWTRIDRQTDLQFELALDEAFTSILGRGPAPATEEHDLTSRVLVTDLLPDQEYWYRFIADGHVTPAARTRTAPAPGTMPAEPLRLAQVSCQKYAAGWWTAFADLAAQAPDLVVHCGDAVYESDRRGVRRLDLDPGTDLESWRAIWRAYRRDPDFQAALAAAPWIFTWDDHEVENNYQGDTPGGRDGTTGDPEFLARRTAAYQAWWEYTPTMAAKAETAAPTSVHRTVAWGDLATFVALDSRQYRDEQPCGDGLGVDLGNPCDDADTTTMLGDAQERWLDEQVTASTATWTALVNQVMVMPWKLAPGTYNLDGWDGYPGARRRLLASLASASNPVLLTGDVHSSWVGEVEADEGSVAVEFVAPGVSSKVPDQLRGIGSLVELQNGHLAWSETERRGWVLHTVTPQEWIAEYRLVADAEVVGSNVSTASTWRIDEGAHRPTRTDR